jgi:hypothetical protein
LLIDEGIPDGPPQLPLEFGGVTEPSASGLEEAFRDVKNGTKWTREDTIRTSRTVSYDR